MTIRSFLKSKKGIAIESAILFMVIIFSFCFLMTSLSLIGHYRAKFENVKSETHVETEQIGEHFMAYANAYSAEIDTFEKYLESKSISIAEGYVYEETTTTDAEKTKFELKVKKVTDDGESVALCIQAEKENGQVTLKHWGKNIPEAQEP